MTKREIYWMSALPEIQQNYRIPKIIHQTFGTAVLPPNLQENIDNLKSMNPDWEHRLYDDAACERLIGDVYGAKVLELYRRIDPDYGAARADLFRYLAVYAVGGVYLDIKSYFDRPISDVIGEDDAFIVAHWDNGADGAHPGFGLHPDVAHWPRGEIQQWHVISSAGHPFLRSVIAQVLGNIESYLPWRLGVGHIGVLRLTGPIVYTLAIEPLLDKYPHRFVDDTNEIGLQYSIGGNYSHTTVFKKHYKFHTKPVTKLPFWAWPPAYLYSYLKKRQQDSLKKQQA